MSSLFADAAGPKERAGEEDPRWQTTLPEGDGEALALAPAQPAAPPAGERHLQELFLTGPAAEALRAHYAGRREPASDPHAIALFDPVRMWAPALLKSLADAGGQPIERLLLRDALALTTLATVERTRIVRPADETLKLQHADVPSGIADAAAVPLVLMERAQLAVVIVGPMHAESVAGMLERILAATHEPGWHCPNLLFMLPPAAVWIANKVVGMGWPQPLRVTVLNESLASTSAVWNAVLGIWAHAKTLAPWSPPPEERPLVEPFEPLHIEPAEPATRPAPAQAAAPAAFDAAQATAALQALLDAEGVLACALVDAGSGQALAREQRDAALDLDALASAAAGLLRAHRLAALRCGWTEPVDEIFVGAGARQQLLRPVAGRPGLLLCAVLDSDRAGLALARYRLLQAERALG